ncbi:hypothetical protein niasHS_015111 [Heterodera schachtii]|uniref:Succinate-semialdehyde dehydrogenase, mitochondrial n=1 Tax=Heterodera schachtii TaxID=97005 RepID=A0ABD2I550_HETSC
MANCQRRGFKTELLPDGAKAFIKGKWIDASSGHQFSVTDPNSGELLCDVANCGPPEAQLAVAAARQKFPRWAFEYTAKERGAILRKWCELLGEREKQLAELLTREQGKPLAESRGEIQYAASYLDWYAAEARRCYGQVVPASKPFRSHVHLRDPCGVCLLITPWNFPAAMIMRKAAAALAVGCTVVVKPAEDTPLTALALAQTSQEAGVPSGVFNVIPSDREETAEVSKYLCESQDVDCVSFTGSTEIGKLLLAQCASTVKRVSLELGGNAPFIVFKSADIDQAVQGAMASKFRCSGQTCVSSNRFFVDVSVLADFVAKLKEQFKLLKLGGGMEKEVNVGPLINRKAVEKVKSLVDEAVAQNAEIICGGSALAETNFFEPTILTNVNGKMAIAHAEIFGPVIPIQTFETEEEVVTKANHSRHGLAGYIFSKDYAQIHRVSRALQVGMVGVNEGMMSCAEAAFGGVKESGLGREGGQQGLDEFTQWKYVCWNVE